MTMWKGKFGEEYTERSIYNPEQLDEFYVKNYGITRKEMNHQFLDNIKVNSILEIGSNVGNQLRMLQSIGYENLYGVELQLYAVEKAKSLTNNINIIQGSAFDVPFKDSYFDLVFTSGVLIHISPKDIKKAIHEIYRLSNRYIWGLEYYSNVYQEVLYRENKDALWKGNFMEMFLLEFPDLKIVKSEMYPYVNGENVDMMYLLEK